MDTTPKSNEPPEAGNDVTTFIIGLITMGSKARTTKGRIGSMVLGSVAASVGKSIKCRSTDSKQGSAGLEKLGIDVSVLAKGISTTLNMQYSNVGAMNPFEG
ncbi:hypothetical protein FBEOM_10138 [Fusarium beomiforme]|uniref:Uncharacterized protein n=1 Tax=Fusarium beomiforme TaxID=44412 RepID=A0A9P5ABY7_9HYPO|nr:hypothetical protein FBEOM_10138 [Fusarium beomiforme]